jgi:hypothetical protein
MPELDPLVYRAAVQHYNLRLRPGSSVNLVDVISYVEQLAATDTEVERVKWSYVVHDLYAGGTLPIGAYTLDFWTKVAELAEADGIVSVVSPRLYRRGLGPRVRFEGVEDIEADDDAVERLWAARERDYEKRVEDVVGGVQPVSGV